MARNYDRRERAPAERAGRKTSTREDGELADRLARSAHQRRVVPGVARQPDPQAKGKPGPGKAPAAPTLGDTIWYWRVAERARRPVNVPKPERGGGGTDDQRVYKDDVLTVGVRVRGVDRTSDLIQADILDAGANVNDAATAYKAAFDTRNKVLKAEAARRRMVDEMLWQALFAGLGASLAAPLPWASEG